MNLRAETDLELERIFFDFMNFYKYINGGAPFFYFHDFANPPMHHYKHNHNHNYKHNHNQNYQPYNTLPYIFAPNREYNTRVTEVLEPATICNDNETFPVVYTPTPDMNNYTNAPTNMMPPNSRVDYNQTEQTYYKALLDGLSNTLIPFIEHVIKNNNYTGSPINDKYLDKESLGQLVSEVINSAKQNNQIYALANSEDPNVRELLKNIVKVLLLGELFIVHRPNTMLNENNMTNINQQPEEQRHNNFYGNKLTGNCNCKKNK